MQINDTWPGNMCNKIQLLVFLPPSNLGNFMSSGLSGAKSKYAVSTTTGEAPLHDSFSPLFERGGKGIVYSYLKFWFIRSVELDKIETCHMKYNGLEYMLDVAGDERQFSPGGGLDILAE